MFYLSSMISLLVSSVIDRGLEPRPGHTEDYKIGICCLSAKHATLRRKSKYWLARNQDNVYEWSDMSSHGLSFQWDCTIKIQPSSTKQTSSSSHWKLTCSCHGIAKKNCWFGFKQQSLTHFNEGRHIVLPRILITSSSMKTDIIVLPWILVHVVLLIALQWNFIRFSFSHTGLSTPELSYLFT